MKLSVIGNALEGYASNGLHGVVVERDGAKSTILLVKVGQLANHFIDHGLAEAIGAGTLADLSPD